MTALIDAGRGLPAFLRRPIEHVEAAKLLGEPVDFLLPFGPWKAAIGRHAAAAPAGPRVAPGHADARLGARVGERVLEPLSLLGQLGAEREDAVTERLAGAMEHVFARLKVRELLLDRPREGEPTGFDCAGARRRPIVRNC